MFFLGSDGMIGEWQMSEELQFNLLVRPWIPVLWTDGRFSRLGIQEALTRSGEIRQIAASNPMDRVALLRFLLSVLMWCRENARSSLAAWDQSSAGIPETWLARLKEHDAAFNLLGDGKRFYQDESLKGSKPRPIADLLVEFPGADSMNHMRHVVHDGSYGFCPACCTMGILRLSVWAPANGSYPASVNPGSAAYALIDGKNLLDTLFANLPETNPQADQASWLGNSPPDSPDVVARLAWRPRKLWLNVGSEIGPCANCGSFDQLITSLCNDRGWETPTTSSQDFAKLVETEFKQLGYSAKGKDPASKNARKVLRMASVIRKCRMDDLRKACSQGNPQPQAAAPTIQTEEQQVARLFHQLISTNDESAQKAIKALTKAPNKVEQKSLGAEDTRAKKFWDADPHLLVDGEPISLPGLGADVAVHASNFWRDALRLQRGEVGRVTVIGPVVKKFVFQDATSVALPDASAAVNGRASLSADCNGGLGGLLKQVTLNPNRQHPEIGSALRLLTPDAEAQIRDQLSRSNAPAGDDAAEPAAFLRDLFEPVVEQVITSVTPGSPLRRYAARNRARNLLNEQIRALLQKLHHSSNADSPAAAPAEPRRSSRKETQDEPEG